MSGIYGVVRYDRAPVTPESLAPIASAMSFWGPDGHGQWCGDSAGLGQLMLCVTPESQNERLPANIRAAPHLIITADARIDNRDELFEALAVPGPGRNQTPDSSLILLAYDRWGPECTKRLLGDYSFAIWDTKNRKLFCARDPFGCRPFVYYFNGRKFLFASDIKGVLAGLDRPRLHEPLLAAHLQMKTYFAEKRLTFFEDIVKLPPAHSLTLTEKGVELSRYWSPDVVPEGIHHAEPEQFAFLFRQAVECRTRSAFPIGSHLSGGLDSSSISIIASRVLRERGRELATFSWSPQPGHSQDASNLVGEYARIDAVCRQEQLSCDYVPATKASLIATFQRNFTVEPTAMMPREANVQARAKERRLRVILSGWGGDDAVTCRASGSGLGGARQRLDSAGRDASFLMGARRLGGILRELAVINLPNSLYELTSRNPFQNHRSPCAQSAFAHLYQREVRNMRGPALRRLAGVRATICLYLESGHLSFRAEHWAASGARHGLVYHYPMLDKRLVEYALGGPARQSGPMRSLFVRAIGDLMPSSIDWHAVKGEAATFAPLEHEHIQAHTEWARHLALGTTSPAARFVDPAKIERAVQLAATTGRIRDLSGVSEAFGFYAIPY